MFRSTFYNSSEKIKELSICKCSQVQGQIKYTCYFLSAAWTGQHCAENLHILLEYSVCCIHVFEKVSLFTKYSIMIIIKIYLWCPPIHVLKV